MRRTLLSCLVALTVCFQYASLAWSQQSSEKAAQPAAAQPAAPARPATDAKQAATPVDPSGTWKWKIDFGGNESELVLKLNWDGKKLDGKYTAFDSTTKVEEGKVDKDGFAFTVRPEFGGNQFEIKFKGKVVKDEVNGSINLDFGNGPQDNPWTAKRFVDEDDVLGVWDIKTETPDGNEFQSTLTVTKDDKGLHAKTSSDFGEFEGKNVKIKDNQFLFEISSENADFSFKSAYSATPRGNSVEGKSAYDFGGNTGEMKFTGKRRPKEEKKAEPVRAAAGDKQAGKEAAATKTDGK